MRAPVIAVASLLALVPCAGCGGTARGNDAQTVFIPGVDARQPADAGPEGVAPDAAGDAARPDAPVADPGGADPVAGDPGPHDPGGTDPGTTDPGPADPGPVDPGPADPGPADPGFPVAEGACTPGDTACWCLEDLHCDPSYGGDCRRNTCGPDHHCRLDDHAADGFHCTTGDACRTAEHCEAGTCRGLWTCACDGDASCDDGNACTRDTCGAGGRCAYAPEACTCASAVQCEDGNPCTTASCSAGSCGYAPVIGGCDDGDDCTVSDRCDGGTCRPGTIACARCKDDFCFKPDETCASCPEDCGTCPATETACADAWDDDGDGLTDCLDPDCSALPECVAPTCFTWDVVPVECGFEDGDGASGNNVSGTACGRSLSSLDRIYRYVSSVARTVRVRVEFMKDEPYRLFVFQGSCNPSNCIDSKVPNTSATSIQLDFAAVAGRPYYIVVEEGAPGIVVDYTMKVTCP